MRENRKKLAKVELLFDAKESLSDLGKLKLVNHTAVNNMGASLILETYGSANAPLNTNAVENMKFNPFACKQNVIREGVLVHRPTKINI